ncbi:hypothetical protein ACROYT_G022124 [Oculina patagonica]
MVAIVIAKETHQKGNSNPADVVDEYAVNKEVRQWRACYGGKCSRRRSRKRGMKMAQTQFENDQQRLKSEMETLKFFSKLKLNITQSMFLTLFSFTDGSDKLSQTWKEYITIEN